jgi:hypothetical protein
VLQSGNERMNVIRLDHFLDTFFSEEAKSFYTLSNNAIGWNVTSSFWRSNDW